MGKRKAVDAPAPHNGTKKLKKCPISQVSPVTGKLMNPLDEIDLLFEEVDAILKSNSHLPAKKSGIPGAGRIPEIFSKKRKTLTTHSSLMLSPSKDSSVSKDQTMYLTAATPGSSLDAPHSQTDYFTMGTMVNPPPLSPVIVVIPNVLCTNRFGSLEEEEDLLACATHAPLGDTTEHNTQSINAPVIDGVLIPHEDVNLALVLQKVDEVKTLVISLMGLLKDKRVLEQGCSCQSTNKKVGMSGGEIVPKLGLQAVIPPPRQL
ncbi:hypothetical protein NDU88_001957 [Pleurodeles waltl]|uniref:Uncharacterized protein n=1 Tax=Pleurodeles waltl TaxID=8319 RepID=A0AAV7RCD5_PLEWA|nr:hypothetical protein NDU88_001957 [Pleurodeles waltl]